MTEPRTAEQVVVEAINSYMADVSDTIAHQFALRLKMHIVEQLRKETTSILPPTAVPIPVLEAYERLADTAVNTAGHTILAEPVNKEGVQQAVNDAVLVAKWLEQLNLTSPKELTHE